jgi:hypothetical protein
MIDGLHPANPRGSPTRHPEAGSVPSGERAVCRIEFIDPYAIAAAHGCAQALHAHVVTACRPSALRDLADVDAAHGIAAYNWPNRSRRRTAIAWMRPVVLDVDTKAGRS